MLRQRTNSIVLEIYSIVGICQPDHVPYGTPVAQCVGEEGERGGLLVAPDSLSLLETKVIHDRSVVRISFFHIRMSSCEVSRDETKIRVMIL